MPILTLRNATLSYGQPPLIDHINLAIDKGERLCLVGRNGAGKSTLFKLITGETKLDEGEIIRNQGLRIAQLEQEVPRDTQGSVFHVVAGGLGQTGALLEEYHRLSLAMAHGEEGLMDALERCQHALESAGGWALNQRVDAVLTRLGLDGDADIGQLSGGLKRRVMLARALVSEPDLLLLDEPTNHLDIDAITWIEEFLLGWSGSLLFITHDRAFLQRLATRIIELDRGRLYDFPCDYANYLIRKEELLANEEKENALFDKKLAQEEVWVRQGIKARRTRNEGRVTALKKMRAEFAARRNLTGTATINVQDAQRSGHLVAEAENVCFAHGEKTIIKNFSTTILRGDKIGIIGPNGAGKTTLLNLLLGKSAPTSGTLRLGTNMQIAYFDQYRAQLDEEKSVQDNVGEGADFIVLNGQRKHIMSYLQDFLFSPARVRQPVKALSGGERNRLLLAKLFTKPANVLVLDEPTNDLDSDTLELLEERLVEYSGTLLLVSHDRAFLNNVVTSTLVFEGGGVINEYVGGYDDWLRQRRVAAAPATSQKNMTNAAPTTPAEPKAKVKKRSYKDQRELDELPAKIEALDAEKAALTAQMNMPEFYRQDKNAIAVTQQRLADIELALAQAYARWEALE